MFKFLSFLAQGILANPHVARTAGRQHAELGSMSEQLPPLLRKRPPPSKTAPYGLNLDLEVPQAQVNDGTCYDLGSNVQGKVYATKPSEIKQARLLETVVDATTFRLPRHSLEPDVCRTLFVKLENNLTAEVQVTLPDRFRHMIKNFVLFLDAANPTPCCIVGKTIDLKSVQGIRKNFYDQFPERHPNKRTHIGSDAPLPMRKITSACPVHYAWSPKDRVTKAKPHLHYACNYTTEKKEEAEDQTILHTTSKTQPAPHPPPPHIHHSSASLPVPVTTPSKAGGYPVFHAKMAAPISGPPPPRQHTYIRPPPHFGPVHTQPYPGTSTRTPLALHPFVPAQTTATKIHSKSSSPLYKANSSSQPKTDSHITTIQYDDI